MFRRTEDAFLSDVGVSLDSVNCKLSKIDVSRNTSCVSDAVSPPLPPKLNRQSEANVPSDDCLFEYSTQKELLPELDILDGVDHSSLAENIPSIDITGPRAEAIRHADIGDYCENLADGLALASGEEGDFDRSVVTNSGAGLTECADGGDGAVLTYGGGGGAVVKPSHGAGVMKEAKTKEAGVGLDAAASMTKDASEAVEPTKSGNTPVLLAFRLLDSVEYGRRSLRDEFAVVGSAAASSVPTATAISVASKQGISPRCGRSCTLCVHLIDEPFEQDAEAVLNHVAAVETVLTGETRQQIPKFSSASLKRSPGLLGLLLVVVVTI